MLEIEASFADSFVLQRGVPHRCAKPLPLQLDFVDDGHGPLLRHGDLLFTRTETDYCQKKSCARRTEHETYLESTGRVRVFRLHASQGSRRDSSSLGLDRVAKKRAGQLRPGPNLSLRDHEESAHFRSPHSGLGYLAADLASASKLPAPPPKPYAIPKSRHTPNDTASSPTKRPNPRGSA